MYRLLPLLILLLLSPRVHARNPESLRQRYLQMQEAYTERADLLESQFAELRRREVNRFIVALVRTEQAFRDEGDLPGVLLTRQLQEDMLERQQFPASDPEFPEKIRELLRISLEQLEASRLEIQEQLNELNRSFADRLEPVMRDLTRAGDFETAREMLDIRNEIFASLDVRTDVRPTHRSIAELQASNDPNVFPVSLEPDALRNHTGLVRRRAQIAFQPRIEGSAEIASRAFRINGGRVTIPAHATEALLHQVRQTQSFTLEMGFLTTHRIQNAPILSFGSTPEESNLAILQRGPNLVLILRTTGQGGETVTSTVDLGPANEGRMQHLVITYRPGDLAIYRNGSNTRRNRADATGDLRNWEMRPIHIGHTDIPNPALPHPRWNGTLASVYMSSTPASARQVTTSFERFVAFVSNR
jgi:hypothetical protein